MRVKTQGKYKSIEGVGLIVVNKSSSRESVLEKISEAMDVYLLAPIYRGI